MKCPGFHGLAAGGVMMVIPAYLYDDEEMHKVVIIGEIVAISAIIMCTLSVLVDLGRPDRFWHMLPGIGRFNWPMSMLTWDVIVLNGYLLINLHIVGYLMYMRFLGRKPKASRPRKTENYSRRCWTTLACAKRPTDRPQTPKRPWR